MRTGLAPTRAKLTPVRTELGAESSYSGLRPKKRGGRRGGEVVQMTRIKSRERHFRKRLLKSSEMPRDQNASRKSERRISGNRVFGALFPHSGARGIFGTFPAGKVKV